MTENTVNDPSIVGQPTCRSITLADLLDQISARTPTPGGGAVSALCGALACALGRMVAVYSDPASRIVKADAKNEAVQSISATRDSRSGARVMHRIPSPEPRIPSIAGQLAKAAAMLVDLADEDQRAYARYREASARAKRDATVQHEADAALAMCLAIPLETCGVAGQVLDVLAGFAPDASRHLLSDLRAAAILAEAAVRAAGCFVRINAAAMTERRAAEEVLETLERMESSAAGRLASVETTVVARLQ